MGLAIFLNRKLYAVLETSQSPHRLNQLSELTVNLPEGVAHNLVEILRWRAEHQGDKQAITFLVDGADEVVSYDYRTLDKKARVIAAYLMQSGQTGDRIMMQFQPNVGFIAAFFGCLYANQVAIPLYPHTRPKRDKVLDRIVNVRKDCEPRTLLYDESVAAFKERICEQAPELVDLKWVNIDDLPNELCEQWELPEIASADLAFLQYTSGSTGTPKGVMVSHGNIMENSHSIYYQFELSPDSRTMLWLPPYHDMGLIGGIIQPIFGGYWGGFMPPVYFLQRPFRWLKAISKYRATICGGPNFTFEFCARKIRDNQKKELDLSSISRMFNGAEPVSAEAMEVFADTFAESGFRKSMFMTCYGLAEATLMVTGSKIAQPPTKLWIDASALEKNRFEQVAADAVNAKPVISSGMLVKNVSVRIVNPDTLCVCTEGEIGEIWAMGNNMAQGYWNRPQLSEETFQAYTADTQEGPFMRTGDLGILHEGELFVTGRIKNLIIIDGSNHYPQDIEWTVEQVSPALRTHGTAAFGVPIDGSEKLVVVSEIDRREWRAAENAGGEALKKSISRAISSKHNLGIYDIVLTTARIPKTTSGKIKHYQCKRDYQEGLYPDYFENKDA